MDFQPTLELPILVFTNPSLTSDLITKTLGSKRHLLTLKLPLIRFIGNVAALKIQNNFDILFHGGPENLKILDKKTREIK